MSKPEFEGWARLEIARLRAEADGLERALQRFLRAENVHPPLGQPNGVITARASRKGTKTSAIVRFVRESGPQGVSLDDVLQFAEKHGLHMKRNSVRSTLYLAKKAGRLMEQGGKYTAKEPDVEASGSFAN